MTEPSTPPQGEAREPPPAASAPQAAATSPANLWVRLWEHKVLQWSLAYLGAAIAIAHGQELVAEAFEWPHLIGRLLMSLLVVGFPIVITLAWYHGHKRLKQIGAGELGIISVLVVIAAGLLVVFVRLPGEQVQARMEQTSHQDISQSPRTAMTVPAGVSIAVLPFVDMSPEHNQDYFSDGLSEEVLNQLAQIKELRVTGRTSSFSFKGKNEDLRVIGEKLGVNHLLEGSVRKSDKRLRVTAQLINAADGTHLWSHSYDSELTDVFAVQEQIAIAVAQALSITLDVGEMSRAKGGTTNVEAYDRYLQARTISNRGYGRQDLLRATELYREALAIDPKFARAWSALYSVLAATLIYLPENATSARKEMADASAHMIALAPDAWWTQAMRARQLTENHRWADAEAASNAALAAAPVSEVEAVEAYSIFLWTVGRATEATEVGERVRQRDPLSLGLSYLLQISLCMSDRMEDYQAEYQRSKGLAGDHVEIDRLAATCHRTVALDSTLDSLHQNYVVQNGTNIGIIWILSKNGLRTNPRFKGLLRDLGLVEYFRASGKWGDFCKPVGTDDFECH